MSLVAAWLVSSCGGEPTAEVTITVSKSAALSLADLAVLHVRLHPAQRTCDDLKKQPTKATAAAWAKKVDLVAGQPQDGAVQFEKLHDQTYRIIAFAGPTEADIRAFGCAQDAVTVKAGELSTVEITLTDYQP